MLKLKPFCVLQIGYLVFSFSSVFLKIASGYMLFSVLFFVFFVASMLCALSFAIIWQRVLCVYDLIFAYAWKGVLFLWIFVWSVVFFDETITRNNLIGTVLVLSGIVAVGISYWNE